MYWKLCNIRCIGGSKLGRFARNRAFTHFHQRFLIWKTLHSLTRTEDAKRSFGAIDKVWSAGEAWKPGDANPKQFGESESKPVFKLVFWEENQGF